MAGPILRASLLLPQIARPRTITREQIVEGLWLIGWGYFQKMFIADNLADLVDAVFDPSATPNGLDVLVAIYAFAFQIYGDFAGYSNIARGLSKLMGIELNVNFLFPYFVISPAAFWRNWHISLSTWLRDYLYIPLGGNRGGEARTTRNLMITMVLGGLWHGAAWTFVLWGAYQGVVLVIGTRDHGVGRPAGDRRAGGPELAATGARRRDVSRHVLRLADLPRGVDRADRPIHAPPRDGSACRRRTPWRRSLVPCAATILPLARRAHLPGASRLGIAPCWACDWPVRYALYGAVVLPRPAVRRLSGRPVHLLPVLRPLDLAGPWNATVAS